jgi:hypothetical protein
MSGPLDAILFFGVLAITGVIVGLFSDMNDRINNNRRTNRDISKRALLALVRSLDLDPNMRRLEWLFGRANVHRRPRPPPHR